MQLPTRLLRDLNALGFVLVSDEPAFSFTRVALGSELHLQVIPLANDAWRVVLGIREPIVFDRFPNPIVPIGLGGLPGGTERGDLELDTDTLSRIPELLESWVIKSVDAPGRGA